MDAILDRYGRTQSEMHVDLLRETGRDLVFLFNVRQNAEAFETAAAEIPDIMERAVRFLLNSKVKVGFGDPDSPTWRPTVEFDLNSLEAARSIVEAWVRDPEYFDHLVFATRPNPNAA